MDHGGLAGVIVERQSMGVGPASTAKARTTPGPATGTCPVLATDGRDTRRASAVQRHSGSDHHEAPLYLANAPAVTVHLPSSLGVSPENGCFSAVPPLKSALSGSILATLASSC